MKKMIMIQIAAFVALAGVLYWKLANSRRFALSFISKLYSPTVASYVDAIYRVESGNFKSNIFKRTKGAGVVAFTTKKPFGFRKKLFRNVLTAGIYHSKNGFDYVRFFTLLDGYKFVANYLTVNGLEISKIEKRVKRYGSQNEAYLSIIKQFV